MATRLECSRCHSRVEGFFDTLGRFGNLTPEQLRFAEVFIGCRGRIGEMEKVLGISYPTVRSRLDEVVRALGYKPEPEEKPRTTTDVLESLSRGEVDVDEAAQALSRLKKPNA
jgi:hypothetical protein